MASALGKRKEREEDGVEGLPHHGSTLFVSNLPYTATSVDLQTLFSDIAPVRSAFVVTEHGTGVSKGVGYVSFAIKEDAQTAFEQISKEGLALAGRKIRVQWAEQKQKEKKGEGEATPKKEANPRPPPRPHQLKLPHDPLSVRTIVISGLPSSLDTKTIWKKIRKYDGAEKVDWPVEDGGLSVAHVLFSSPRAASDAVNKLHAHVFKGHLLSVTLKKRLENLAKPAATKTSKDDSSLKAETSAQGAAAPSRASRLIVRNLPFNITEQDLRAVFLPYGPVHSIHIPTTSPEKAESLDDTSQKRAAKPRAKGFAFVWMLSKKDAEKALEGCNGKTVSAGMAESLVSDKQKRKKQRREEKRLKALAAKSAQNAEEEEEKEEENGDDSKVEERVIAVDWALSKDKWQEEKAKMEQDQGDEDAETDDASESESENGQSDGESDSEDGSHIGVHEGDEDEDEDEDSQTRSDDEEEPVKPSLPPTETGNTLFIRNVPFEATEDDLRTLFRAFGPLRYARITLDPATGRSRGTGFACFWNREDADKVVTQSELLRAETTGSTAPEPMKNPFKLPSILTPDPSSTLAQSLVLHGRTLDCVRAVTRDEAGKLKEAGEKARQKADKRNMYLLREGVILPNSPAAASMSPAELERRSSSHNARRALLKSNPSLYISKTRLSIRQIPLFVSERALRRLAIHATKAFQAEAAAGERTALTADELAVDTTAAEDAEETAPNEEKKDKGRRKSFFGKRKPTSVKQAKIVRQAERVDAITGKSRSKGYGFLETYSHADSLRVLRWANNNSSVAPLFEEWWKDEMKNLLKLEQGKKEGEKDEARITRLKAELEKRAESGTEKKSRGNLIVEFSIENVQVVQRRNATAQHKTEKSDDVERKRKPSSEAAEERPAKKRKAAKATTNTEPHSPKAEAETPTKYNPVGSIIGRKRKERRKGKKA